MNVEKVKRNLSGLYPEVRIIENTDLSGAVTEIVGEIDKKSIGSERAVAVVVADSSAEHFHRKTVEEYQVLKGVLRVFTDGQQQELQPGERIIIEPGVRHRVEGDETWFYCYSVPPWTPDDFHLIETS